LNAGSQFGAAVVTVLPELAGELDLSPLAVGRRSERACVSTEL